MNIIVAISKNNGIGYHGKMAWKCLEELALFRKITENSVLVMGRKTVENLPTLNNRTILCVTKNPNLDTTTFKNECIPVDSLEYAYIYSKKNFPGKKIFIAGGSEIYAEAMKIRYLPISKMYISIMKNDIENVDTFFEWNRHDWIIDEYSTFSSFDHYVLIPDENGEERQYLNLLDHVMRFGMFKTGRNGDTKSVFKRDFTFDLTKGFPLLTTKKMFFRGIVEELLFFLRGDTDSKILQSKGVNIWKANTERKFLDSIGMENRPEGIMGPLYGYQFRNFNAEYDEQTGKAHSKGVDQLLLVVNTLLNDPNSRRILMTSFNPAQASQGVLYPCHSICIQFYVENGCLDMFCYNRSQDLFLGVPFNIASSALLLTIIAKITNLIPRFLHMTMGDVHIYTEHFKAVDEQLSRMRYKFPTLQISELSNLSDLENLSFENFTLENYHSQKEIKAKMIA